MTTSISHSDTSAPVPPTEDDSRLARESSRLLAEYLGARGPLQLQILIDGRPTEAALTLPESALRLLSRILAEMAEGNAVTLMPVHAELTTQQAADLLNVSRPFLIGLLEEGKIPFRKVGTHRRVLFKDLMDYKKKSDERCHQAFNELAALDEEMGLDY